jgi:hypothetical protein
METIRQTMEVSRRSSPLPPLPACLRSILLAGRFFTIFYASFGLAFIFSMMNSFATSIIKAAEETALERLHSNPEQNRVCGPPLPPPLCSLAQARYITKFFLSILSILVCVSIGTAFVMINENLNIAQGLYWSAMTTLVQCDFASLLAL